MISEIAKTLLEFLKLAPRYLIALGIASAFLLFSPDSVLKRLGVLEFAQAYRQWLGIILVLSAALFAVTMAKDMIGWFKKRRSRTIASRRMIRRLYSLTEDEKQILRFYIAEQTRANSLRIDDGVVQGLVANGIIYRSTWLGHMLEGFAHNITEEAWDYLQLHPELLAGSTNTYRTDKRLSNW